MDVELGIAGFVCIALALGHTTVGVMWVLPRLAEDQLPRTPFGSTTMTASMVRVTWFVVTIFALGMGGLLLSLAWDAGDPRALLLRWLAAMWAAATLMTLVVVRHPLRSLLRLPVPLLWVLVAVLCWRAA